MDVSDIVTPCIVQRVPESPHIQKLPSRKPEGEIFLQRSNQLDDSHLSCVAAARTELKLDDFLAWLGNMELLAGEEEQACAAIMDKALHRLEQEGEMELAAALLSGDETTFRLFRTQAPELVHLPDATYEWYCKNYLDRYYPVRFILHHQGIEFPQA